MQKGVFEVKSTNGDTHLGGEDFDVVLVNPALHLRSFYKLILMGPHVRNCLFQYSKKLITSCVATSMSLAACFTSFPLEICGLNTTRVPKATFEPGPLGQKLGPWGDSAYRCDLMWT